MTCEIWSWPIFEIFSILDITPDFLILESVPFRSVVRCANQYTTKTLVCCPQKTCVVIKSTDNPDIFEQPYVDDFVYFGVPGSNPGAAIEKKWLIKIFGSDLIWGP